MARWAVSDYPNTITVCGVELERRDPGHSDAHWSGAIGPLYIALWTKSGHWYGQVKPPPWIMIPERMPGPLPQADVLVAIEREAAKCIAAIRRAEANWLVAGEWLEGAREP